MPVSQARDYQRRLATAGVSNQLLLMRGQGHVTGFLFQGTVMDEAWHFSACRQPSRRRSQ